MGSDLKGSATPWRHFGVLVGIAAIGLLAIGWLSAPEPVLAGSVPDRVLWAAGRMLRQLFPLLAPMAGLAVATGRVGRGWYRSCVQLAAVVTVLMLVLDLSVASFASPPSPTHALLEGGEVVEVTPRVEDVDVSLVSAIGVLLKQPQAVHDVLDAYPTGHPRPAFLASFIHSLLLLLPAVLVGLVVGLRSWVVSHVRFTQPRDEWVATLVLAWVFVPSAAWTCHSMAWEIGDGALRGTVGIAAPALAYLPFGVLAVLGWRAGGQLSALRTPWTGGQDA